MADRRDRRHQELRRVEHPLGPAHLAARSALRPSPRPARHARRGADRRVPHAPHGRRRAAEHDGDADDDAAAGCGGPGPGRGAVAAVVCGGRVCPRHRACRRDGDARLADGRRSVRLERFVPVGVRRAVRAAAAQRLGSRAQRGTVPAATRRGGRAGAAPHHARHSLGRGLCSRRPRRVVRRGVVGVVQRRRLRCECAGGDAGGQRVSHRVWFEVHLVR